MRYKYADEAQKAVDKLDGEFCYYLGVRRFPFYVCILDINYIKKKIILREERGWTRDHGAICKVWA